MWIDIRAKLKDDGEFRGMMIDPLDVDAHLPEPIDIRQKGKRRKMLSRTFVTIPICTTIFTIFRRIQLLLKYGFLSDFDDFYNFLASAYSADVKMSGIKLFGLSSIRLDEASVTRDENLTDLHLNVKLGFDELTITGEYDLKGSFGWWEVDSNGTRDFAINLYGASFETLINFDMVDESESDGGRCGPEGNVVISEMGFPFRHDAVNFRFDNLGPFVNSMASGIGAYFIQMQEELIIKEIKSVIRKEVASLLC